MIGLNQKEDVSNETRPSRLRQDRKQRNSVKQFLQECREPFEPNDDDELLINISTGKATTFEATSFLLNVISIGAKARDNFIQSVSARPSAFEESIRRQKVFTFASDGPKIKKKSADGTKVIEVRMERDLMGSILAIFFRK